MYTPVLIPGWPLDREPARSPRRLRLRDRAAVRLFAFRLDFELAEGIAPDRTPAHRLRAHRLRCRALRAALARSLNAVVRDARTGRRRMSVANPRRPQVLGATAELEALAHRLVAPSAVDPRGVAETAVLLADGSGPLYDGTATTRLRDAARRAVADLEPCVG
jgi:hypothetical protein